jgi:hypothetical protein
VLITGGGGGCGHTVRTEYFVVRERNMLVDNSLEDQDGDVNIFTEYMDKSP